MISLVLLFRKPGVTFIMRDPNKHVLYALTAYY
jgi:hypothetical protein